MVLVTNGLTEPPPSLPSLAEDRRPVSDWDRRREKPEVAAPSNWNATAGSNPTIKVIFSWLFMLYVSNIRRGTSWLFRFRDEIELKLNSKLNLL